jgi:hypothetical protein
LAEIANGSLSLKQDILNAGISSIFLKRMLETQFTSQHLKIWRYCQYLRLYWVILTQTESILK